MKSNLETNDYVYRGRNRDRFITLAVAVTGALIVAGLFWFNQTANGYEYYLTGNSIALFFIPMLMIFLAFGGDPSEFGFQIGHSKRVLWLTILLFVGLMIILVPASRNRELQEFYPIFKRFYPYAEGSFRDGDYWQLAYGWLSYGLYMFFWEFFFRGYLLFGLSRTIKWSAVLVQAVPFCLLHLGKAPIEVAASFPAGIILGMLALRSKSFFPCFLLHWTASVAFDLLIIISRSGQA